MSKANPWKQAHIEAKAKECSPPPGCESLSQIAEQMEVCEDSARRTLKVMIEAGRVEAIPGRALTSTGTTIRTTYYRLVGKPSGQINVKK